MLKMFVREGMLVAGLDEAGRGCFAGPVFAAAVILPEGFRHPLLNDSKQLSGKHRNSLRQEIEASAAAWAVAMADNREIDEINILNASILAMQRAVGLLTRLPGFLAVDGNRFKTTGNIPFECVVKGDATYMQIAAASILAKTHRDEFMEKIHLEYPMYNWASNKGYATRDHQDAINTFGISPYHRRSFNMNEQLKMF